MGCVGGVNGTGISNNGPMGSNNMITAGTIGEIQETAKPNNDQRDISLNSTQVNQDSPPDLPSLLLQGVGGASFKVHKQPVDTRQELKLSIEFPLNKSNSRICIQHNSYILRVTGR